MECQTVIKVAKKNIAGEGDRKMDLLIQNQELLGSGEGLFLGLGIWFVLLLLFL